MVMLYHQHLLSAVVVSKTCSMPAVQASLSSHKTHQNISLRTPHADKYAADQVYTLCYLSMSDAGGLTLLTAALDQGNVLAAHAFSVLQRLSAEPTLPIEQAAANEALLARMQGLRRCSALLCPIFSQDQALQAQRGDASGPHCPLPTPPHPQPAYIVGTVHQLLNCDVNN